MARRIDRLEAELTARESGVRHLAAERGVEVGKVKDYALGVLVRHCGDAELAADALTLDPRPAWLTAIVGAR
jgi:hypothetical protein